ncbi:MAG TPA: LemA family protein [Burkholderiaceae bacterium]|nr:LemA family protein [Burkholderiaceae bacterium]
MMVGYVLLGLIAAIVVWAILAYNGLVGSRNQVKNSFAQIDVQLKRRYDLIPNLVETAKGYIKHERETLEAVTRARNLAVSAHANVAADPTDAEAVKQLGAAEQTLRSSLMRFFAVAEAYPDLKANQNMMQVSEELTSTENKIAFARQAFNDSVMSYNNVVQQFPGNLIANVFGFKTAEQLAATEAPEERKAVHVQF